MAPPQFGKPNPQNLPPGGRIQLPPGPGQSKELKCSCGCVLFQKRIFERLLIDRFAPKNGMYWGEAVIHWNCKDCGKLFDPSAAAAKEPD